MDCNATETRTCDVYGRCCSGLPVCSVNRMLCSKNITLTCDGKRCRAEAAQSVCCPFNSQCCDSYGELACCVENNVWWKWPALIASSSFLLLTLLLLYYTYRQTMMPLQSGRRRDRNVIHHNEIIQFHPPPYQLTFGPEYLLNKPCTPHEPPPYYTSREITPQSLHSDRGSIKSSSRTPSIIHDTNAMMSYSNMSLESEAEITFDNCNTYRTHSQHDYTTNSQHDYTTNSQQGSSPYTTNILNSPDRCYTSNSPEYSPESPNSNTLYLTNSEDLSSDV